VSTPIDEGGGTVDTGTGDSVEGTLSFGSGDLDGETTITIDVFEAPDVALPPGGGEYLSRVFDFGPDGLTFDSPISFTIIYTDAEVAALDESQLGVWLFDSIAAEWSLADVLDRDLPGNTLTVAVSHFSEAAVRDLSTSNFDGDGCTDAKEIGTNQLLGGRRDPTNPWDYFNPGGGGRVRLLDVLMVVNQYYHDDNDGSPGLAPYAAGYTTATDRTLLGPDPWNLGPPDGRQRVDDILNAVKQYFHDCA
jgi:hypothetical protein